MSTKYRTTTRTAAEAKGLRVQTWTAADLYASLPEDGTPSGVWNSFGVVRGIERFALSYMARSEGRIEVVKASAVERMKANPADRWPADIVLAHPTSPDAARTLRILVR